jgi:hypothetical protein
MAPGAGADGLGLLRPRRRPRRDHRRRGRVGHRAPGPSRQGRDRQHRARARGPRSSTRTRSSTRPPAPGCPTPRSPRCPTPRSPAGRKPTRSPAGSSCAGSPTCTRPRNRPPGRAPCSTCGASTRSSPPSPRSAGHRRRDKTHRGHAIIEQVHADLKASALAHLPSGRFTANSAWLVLAVIAFNLTRAAAALTAGARAGQGDHRHRAPQVDPRPRPGRVLRPTDHPAPAPRLALAAGLDPPVRPRRRPTRHRLDLTTQPADGATPGTRTWNTPTVRSGDHPRPHTTLSPQSRSRRQPKPVGGSRLSMLTLSSGGPAHHEFVTYPTGR